MSEKTWIEEADEIGRQEMLAEIHLRHTPVLHAGEPCPTGGCCNCGAIGFCDAGALIVLLKDALNRAQG